MTGEVPGYLEKDGTGRYECTKCGESVAALFADLGCDVCNGEGVSEGFKDAILEAEQAVWNAQNGPFTDAEKEKLEDILKYV